MLIRSILTVGFAAATAFPALAGAPVLGIAPADRTADAPFILAANGPVPCGKRQWEAPGGICNPYARGKHCPPGYQRREWDGHGYRCYPKGRLPGTGKTF